MATRAQTWSPADLLDSACGALESPYPQFRRVAPPTDAVLALEGEIQPFTGGPDLRLLVPDLERGKRVYVAGGTLVHDPGCRDEHPLPNYYAQLLGMHTTFLTKVLVQNPSLPPRAYSLVPFVAPLQFHSTEFSPPHTYSDGAICGYFPSTDPLPFDESRLVLFLDYTAIWLAKFLIWQRTGAFGNARWIGPAADHSPLYLLENVRPNWPCPCGKPREYYRCCRDEHVCELMQQMIGGK